MQYYFWELFAKRKRLILIFRIACLIVYKKSCISREAFHKKNVGILKYGQVPKENSEKVKGKKYRERSLFAKGVQICASKKK